jgi:threonine/homoserine/homoserine lactone efflux protein
MRQQIVAFAAVTVPLVLTPGIATTLVLRTSLVEGTRRGLVTALGINASSLCYGFASGAGTAVLLRAWPTAVSVLQVVGAFYLGWLGVRSLAIALTDDEAAAGRASETSGFREGFLANALNPPIVLFYFLIVPRFVPDGMGVLPATLVLTAVHVALAFSWHSACALAAGALSRVLSTPRARRSIELTAGALLLFFAVRMLRGSL